MAAGKLYASDAGNGDFFGRSHDRSLSVSAGGHDHVGSNAGAVYVFERQAGIWSQVQEFARRTRTLRIDTVTGT